MSEDNYELEKASLIVKTTLKEELTNTKWKFANNIPDIIKLSMLIITKEQLNKERNRMLGK